MHASDCAAGDIARLWRGPNLLLQKWLRCMPRDPTASVASQKLETLRARLAKHLSESFGTIGLVPKACRGVLGRGP